MKKIKIIFCVLLAVAITVGVLGIRLGKNSLNAYVETVKGSPFFIEYYEDRSLFEEYIEGFGFDITEFDRQFIDNYENCYGQRAKIMITNENDFDITVLGLEVKEGVGAKGIYISSTPEKVVTVPANTKEPVEIWFRIVSEGPERFETEEIIDKYISIKLIYTDASNNVQSLSDASDDILKYEWLR